MGNTNRTWPTISIEEVENELLEQIRDGAGGPPLPTGAATAARQDTGNTSLSNIYARQANKSAMVQVTDGTNEAPIQVGQHTGGKGLRVFVGPTDPISDLPVFMDYDHHQLHEGEMFRWSVYTAALGSGVNKDVRLVVPSITVPPGVPDILPMPHLRFEFLTALDSNLFFYEAPTFSANGTQRTPIAMERNGTYTPKLQIWEDPTVTGTGTLLWQGMVTGGNNKAGAATGSSTEFVLKNNTAYLIRMSSLANANRCLARLVWYEDLGV